VGTKSVISLPSHDGSPEEQHSSSRNSGQQASQASQPLSVKEQLESFLHRMTDVTSGCTIEQLEQINREMMDEMWRSRHEWNRLKVLWDVTSVFNQTISDIESTQGVGPLSQQRDYMDA
jgi:acetolactate synthase small subunit